MQNECSFVSLRDIERAMIVLEWFHSVLDDIEKDALYQDDHNVRMFRVGSINMTFSITEM